MTALELLNTLALHPAVKVVSVTSGKFLSSCASTRPTKQTKIYGAHQKQTNKTHDLASRVGCPLLFAVPEVLQNPDTLQVYPFA